MRDRLLRIVDSFRLPSAFASRNDRNFSSHGGGRYSTQLAAEEWEVVAVETAAHELVETVAAHAPLASEVLQLNGV